VTRALDKVVRFVSWVVWFIPWVASSEELGSEAANPPADQRKARLRGIFSREPLPADTLAPQADSTRPRWWRFLLVPEPLDVPAAPALPAGTEAPTPARSLLGWLLAREALDAPDVSAAPSAMPHPKLSGFLGWLLSREALDVPDVSAPPSVMSHPKLSGFLRWVFSREPLDATEASPAPPTARPAGPPRPQNAFLRWLLSGEDLGSDRPNDPPTSKRT
jgi:hypothetical protein